MRFNEIQEEQKCIYAVVHKEYSVYNIAETFNTLEEVEKVLAKKKYKNEYRVIEIALPECSLVQ